MKIVALECAKCGAPLPEAEPVVKCSRCGMINVIEDLPEQHLFGHDSFLFGTSGSAMTMMSSGSGVAWMEPWSERPPRGRRMQKVREFGGNVYSVDVGPEYYPPWPSNQW